MTDSQMFPDLGVENVYLYVGDAVRWDYRSRLIDERGLTIKTVAASTHSPSSFASIFTGVYPPAHGVDGFEHRLSDDIFSLLDIEGMSTTFINSIFKYATRTFDGHDPIFDVLRETPNERTVKDLLTDDGPFLIIERGPGGHAPYGDFEGSAVEYFHHAGAAGGSRFTSDYERSIELDAKLVEKRLDQLAAAGHRDDTLVIYASDHGELLGEDGCVGHNSPMRPELVYTPTIFIHPDVDNRLIDDSAMHHTDLVPTILGVLGKEADTRICGNDIANGISTGPHPCYYQKTFPTPIPELSAAYKYWGAWDANGGHVFARCSRGERLTVLAGLAVKSPKRAFIRRTLHKSVRVHWPDTFSFGQPRFTPTEALERVEEVNKTRVKRSQRALSEAAREQLADLGYVQD